MSVPHTDQVKQIIVNPSTRRPDLKIGLNSSSRRLGLSRLEPTSAISLNLSSRRFQAANSDIF